MSASGNGTDCPGFSLTVVPVLGRPLSVHPTVNGYPGLPCVDDVARKETVFPCHGWLKVVFHILLQGVPHWGSTNSNYQNIGEEGNDPATVSEQI